ncbi:hypothetical protein, partial [Glutamicibacter sp. NPDC088455]|uniref:hypothetical protein n=1 Tax=Glutamicibacter sp. NPDC088455 TaxID=3363999 RepID=UPI003813A74A
MRISIFPDLPSEVLMCRNLASSNNKVAAAPLSGAGEWAVSEGAVRSRELPVHVVGFKSPWPVFSVI